MKSHFDESSKFREIMNKTRADWANILGAAKAARENREKLNSMLQNGEPLGNEDLSFVVFGSLAREEWTSGSDVDWTLLIDGEANPQHLKIAQAINEKLEEVNFREPGRTGVFGNLSFSHEIIHQIGGQSDTNRNTTQRILLLLESVPLGDHVQAFDRVTSGVLSRYLEEDPSSSKVPRFLLNDIIRFWRTVAVDFASKQRERAGKGWGLRNAKLRMSRKLIFTAGMLLCFNSKRSAEADGSESTDGPILKYLQNNFQTTPLEVVADACTDLDDGGAEIGNKIFSQYDLFLKVMNDPEKRGKLESLRSDGSKNCPVFDEVRAIGNGFQEGLIALLFSDPFAELTKEYGVF